MSYDWLTNPIKATIFDWIPCLYYTISYFVCFWTEESPQTNHLKAQTKTSNEYPDQNRTKTRNKNIGMIWRSQQTERTNSACFIFPTETNTCVREFPESKRPNGTIGRVPRQTIKDGLAERPLNSLSGLHKRLLQIPQETKETSGTFANEASVSDLQLNEEIVPPYREHELFERTSVFVCFILRMQAKTDETEVIQTIAKHLYDCKLVPKHVD